MSKSFSSLYRLNLSRNFNLKAAIAFLPYLKKLGIEGVYLAPLFEAESEHGYDIINPNRLNPELGTIEDFQRFCQELKKEQMVHILDIVPNHMGMGRGRNKWWQDLLEFGQSSSYAHFFDIDFNSEKKSLKGKILLPILGETYGDALKGGLIQLKLDPKGLFFSYRDFQLPLSCHSLQFFLQERKEELHGFSLQERAAFLKKELLKWHSQDPIAFNERLHFFCSSEEGLHKLLELQFYRLSFWRTAKYEINYRRFFDINQLVALRMEDEKVLEAHHKWIFELINKGWVQGVRVDHPEGLYDPANYFHRFRKHVKSVLIFVEKILDRKEKIPSNWEVEGSVGYEYLNELNGLFVLKTSEHLMTHIYETFIGHKVDFSEILYQCKKLYTTYYMVSEVQALGKMLSLLAEKERHARDFTRHDLTEALQEFIAFFPVYRTYIQPNRKSLKADLQFIHIALQRAKNHCSHLEPLIFDYLERIFSKPKKREMPFVLRLQQITGPIMGKGLEDTSFYRYNRFISLNEVGSYPTHFGHAPDDFHHFNSEKLKHWPLGLLPSATHDTKRSEDVRMRLNVLTEMAEKWQFEVTKWAHINKEFSQETKLSPNNEYFLYQTLLGIWPKEELEDSQYQTFCDRIFQIMIKSLREAKQETSWHNPNSEFEENFKKFFYQILDRRRKNHFLERFLPFQKEIDRFGEYNTLSATLLRLGSCGIVEVYQGSEIWKFSLVDPDNRIPIDPKLLKRSLEEGEIKSSLYQKVLIFRRANPELFLYGKYIPLKVTGKRKENLIAFARKLDNKFLFVIAARFFVDLLSDTHQLPIGEDIWGDTRVILPAKFALSTMNDLLTQKKIEVKSKNKERWIECSSLFTHLPMGLLYELHF